MSSSEQHVGGDVKVILKGLFKGSFEGNLQEAVEGVKGCFYCHVDGMFECNIDEYL